MMIVDDHVMVRSSIALVLNHQPDLEVVSQVSSSEAAIAALESHVPDAAIIDLTLGKESGLSLIPKLVSKTPSLAVVVLTMHDEMLFGEKALAAGAKGYVTKDQDPDSLVQALRVVLAGNYAISERLQAKLAKRELAGLPEIESGAAIKFSNRELEVLRCTAQHLDKSTIAQALGISRHTVETHRSNLKIKLGVRSQYELYIASLEYFPEFAPLSFMGK
ncbi:MAG: response regulator transcription factor [Burkholderiales bacterium]|nr:response regulator transcription factor [Burkholderiales bacterium]